ncbi:MAG: dTDP-4-dehydrorhamnose reductase [Flavobacteriaceae bacterium]|nr:MAG: dTDP-4-dehydrorhamnose reductase [Flavobacteriaceae bacterium]
MKVLITGCHGQVGTELVALAPGYGVQAVGFERSTLDITNKDAVLPCVAKEKPDVLINAAAYTAVDKAESDTEAAFAVNATAVGYLAEACAKQDIPLVHISTDYVFDGSKQGEYSEQDVVSPLGMYGESKLAGEEAVRKLCAKHYILRTSWVFSAHGNNFVKTMLRLGKERDTLGVVSDQYGKPTSAREIASTIYAMLVSNQQAWGTYHIAQPEVTSWFGFADAIFKEAKRQGMALNLETLNAIGTADFPTPAKRPQNSALDCTQLEQIFGLTIKPWSEDLMAVLAAWAIEQQKVSIHAP